jgi:hypothetical protein
MHTALVLQFLLHFWHFSSLFILVKLLLLLSTFNFLVFKDLMASSSVLQSAEFRSSVLIFAPLIVVLHIISCIKVIGFTMLVINYLKIEIELIEKNDQPHICKNCKIDITDIKRPNSNIPRLVIFFY